MYWSPYFHKQRGKEEAKKHKVHATLRTAAATTVALFFTLYALISNFMMPKHRTNLNTPIQEKITNRFYEINELYDGTLNEVHHILYSTNISYNKYFTFKRAMK